MYIFEIILVLIIILILILPFILNFQNKTAYYGPLLVVVTIFGGFAIFATINVNTEKTRF